MISNIKLKFGHTATSGPTVVQAASVTVFVGPNNSGKSIALSEITALCENGTHRGVHKIVDSVEFCALSQEEADLFVSAITQKANPNESINPNMVKISGKKGQLDIDRTHLIRLMTDPHSAILHFCRQFLTHSTLRLDGPSRIGLVQDQHAGNLQDAAANSLQYLFKNNRKREEVRRILEEAFGLYFVIDPTNLGSLKIRLSERPPSEEIEEKGIHDAAIAFHSSATPLSLASDGVKAFTGIIIELVAGDPHVLLIDEPEAFLHPSLSFKLGLEVSRAALSTRKRVFVSTHSPSFVMGCIQSAAPINIIRLTYRNGVPTARVLPNSEILELMRNPLLRSTGVMSALSYEFVVVTESDADRAFYQEVNERLLRFKAEWGIPNCLFINAQNKQTIQTILRPLRKLGIPAAGIVDIDIIKEGGAVWANLLSSANVPQVTADSSANTRASLKRIFEATGQEMKRNGGISILDAENRESATNLFDQLSDYGIFVVPGGELESWLKPLGATGHGPSWLINIFEKMGEDPESNNYLKPSDDDVWNFLSKIRRWLSNPERKGIPS